MTELKQGTLEVPISPRVPYNQSRVVNFMDHFMVHEGPGVSPKIDTVPQNLSEAKDSIMKKNQKQLEKARKYWGPFKEQGYGLEKQEKVEAITICTRRDQGDQGDLAR